MFNRADYINLDKVEQEQKQKHDINDSLDNILFNIEAQEEAMCDKLYDFLKKQYSDVCSNGDVVINKIIDYLFSCDNSDNSNEYYYYNDESYKQRKKNVKKYINSIKWIKKVSASCIGYIEYDIKRFIDSNGCIKANPFWAS